MLLKVRIIVTYGGSYQTGAQDREALKFSFKMPGVGSVFWTGS